MQHFTQTTRLSELDLGEGDQRINWKILANAARMTERLVCNFKFTAKEQAQLSEQLGTLLEKAGKDGHNAYESTDLQPVIGNLFKHGMPQTGRPQ